MAKFRNVEAPPPTWWIPWGYPAAVLRRRAVMRRRRMAAGGGSMPAGDAGRRGEGGPRPSLSDMSRGMGQGLAGMSAGLGAMLSQASNTLTSAPVVRAAGQSAVAAAVLRRRLLGRRRLLRRRRRRRRQQLRISIRFVRPHDRREIAGRAVASLIVVHVADKEDHHARTGSNTRNHSDRRCADRLLVAGGACCVTQVSSGETTAQRRGAGPADRAHRLRAAAGRRRLLPADPRASRRRPSMPRSRSRRRS